MLRFLPWILCLWTATTTLAAGQGEGLSKKVAVVRSAFDTVNLLGKDRGAAQSLALNADLTPDSKILAPPGLRGQLDIKEGDLRLTLIGDLPGLWNSQVLETVATLHASTEADLDFTLARGLALLEYRGEKGSAKVRLRLDDKKLDVELHGKGSAIALELSSRWPEGMPFLKKPDKQHQPVGELLLFVLKGKIDLALENEKQLLNAPVLFRWTSRMGVEGPLGLKKEPDWARSPLLANLAKDSLALQDAAEKVRRGLEKKKLADLAQDKFPAVRQVVVYRQAALDQLGPVIAALTKDDSAPVRQAAARALRHYSGRSQAADQEVHQALVTAGWKAGQAQILMHLLHGFSAEEKRRPETYDALIGYLQSDQPGIRELAHMTLLHLVPHGKTIAFDAAADMAIRTQTQTAWRALIPEGKLPTPPEK